jgi:hypothetical protein
MWLLIARKNSLTRAMKARLFFIFVAMALTVGCREQPEAARPAKEALPTIEIAPFDMGRPDLVLLVTGTTKGSMEMVSCCGVMPGGLSQRNSAFRSYEAAFPRTLRVDTGDSFYPREGDVINDYLVRADRALGYDVMVLGCLEWSEGPARLSRLLAGGSGRPAWLSTTVRQAGGEPAVPAEPSFRREWNGLKIAFVSDVSAEGNLMSPRQAARIAVDEGAAGRACAELKSRGYVVVLASNAAGEPLERLVRSAKPDLVIAQGAENSDANLLQVAGRPLVRVGGGDFVGAVAMKFAGSRVEAIEYRLEKLDDRWPQDDRMVQMYQAYTHAAAVQYMDARRKTPLAYVPSEECGRCHPKQHESWKASPHATAYGTLVKAGRQNDADCLICHTTGMGLSSGFESIRKTPRLANVNCQDCHRFNVDEHRQPGFHRDEVSSATCYACHNNLNSRIGDFYENMLKEISH